MLSSSSTERSSVLEEVARLRQENENLKEAHKVALNEQEEQQQLIEKLESSGDATSDLRAKLEQANKKIEHVNAEKVKLEGYLKLAKSMVKELKQKGSPEPSLEAEKHNQEKIALLEKQLAEKDKQIAVHKHQLTESRESARREQRAMIAAFHEVGRELSVLKQTSQSPRSFLGQLRQNATGDKN